MRVWHPVVVVSVPNVEDLQRLPQAHGAVQLPGLLLQGVQRGGEPVRAGKLCKCGVGGGGRGVLSLQEGLQLSLFPPTTLPYSQGPERRQEHLGGLLGPRLWQGPPPVAGPPEEGRLRGNPPPLLATIATLRRRDRSNFRNTKVKRTSTEGTKSSRSDRGKGAKST